MATIDIGSLADLVRFFEEMTIHWAPTMQLNDDLHRKVLVQIEILKTQLQVENPDLIIVKRAVSILFDATLSPIKEQLQREREVIMKSWKEVDAQIADWEKIIYC